MMDDRSPMITPNLSALYRGVSEIFPDRPDSSNPDENLAQLLAKVDRPLRVKLGIDPTGSDIHLGHSICIRKMRAFQDVGHTAVTASSEILPQELAIRQGNPRCAPS